MASPNRRAKQRSTIRPIEDRNIEVGTVLTSRYTKETRTCEVVQTDEGLRFKLDTGEVYRSASSAGTAAVDGWRATAGGSGAFRGRSPRSAKRRRRSGRRPRPRRRLAGRRAKKEKTERARAEDGVRLRPLRRDLQIAEGGDRACADAHRELA